LADSTSRTDRRQRRRELRAARRAVPPETAAQASRSICAGIAALPAFRSSRHVAVFLPFDGEPDLTPLLRSGAAARKQLYVPVITRTTMRFAPWSARAALAPNFFGILEPSALRTVDPRRLDLVLTPLVAFDAQGTRIGVGRGYYDRCFGFLRHRRLWRHPKLLGVAYELQHVPELEAQPWDVPLWGAVTEARLRRFGAGE
jgi:5-formyltetrahydrofolate cyclo-ligase